MSMHREDTNSRNAILVTGGAGFIGTNLVPKLAEAGHSIRVLDNFSRSTRGIGFPGEELLQGDIRELGVVRQAMEGIDTVVHLAAYGSVVESVSDPRVNFDHNVLGTWNVLETARKTGARRLIFASTGGALIGEAEPPVDETSLPKPIAPYGASKLCGEAYCHAFAKAYGIETVMLRFANVYGPYSAHKKGAVTAFFKALLRGEPMTIFGDGSASRDFLHVEDLCRGILLALEGKAVPGAVFHLASGVETSVTELAETIAAIGERPGHPIEYHSPRPGEVTRNFAHYGRAREVLGFEPRWSLYEGLTDTWYWFLSQGEAALTQATSDA